MAALDTDTLMRGSYVLGHQAQSMRRDLTGEHIMRTRWYKGRAFGYRMTAEQVEERRTTGRGGLPYEYLLYTQGHTSWTAFYTRDDMQKFLDAYGITLDHEPAPGDQFRAIICKDTSKWQPLNDPGVNDPELPAPAPELVPAELDERDAAILARRVALLDAIDKAKVGDFVRFADGEQRRISHIWDWDDGDPEFPQAQTSDGGSYYLGDGYVSMSGGLYPPVHTNTLTDTGETKLGSVWFFHHDRSGAHRGVDTAIPFRVWSCSVDSPD